MNALDNLRNWFDSLLPRERTMVTITGIVVAITLFYITVWEPLHNGLREQREKLASQHKTLSWMQQAAREVSALRAAGMATAQRRNDSGPVTLTIEKTASSAGIRNRLSKLESSGQDSARARFDDVDFNQMILWLNTVEQTYGIQATSVTIEKTDKPGMVDARITFSRSG